MARRSDRGPSLILRAIAAQPAGEPSAYTHAQASPDGPVYDAWPSTGAAKSQGGMSVECSLIGDRLLELGVHKLSLVSIDVEGSELTVVKSLLNARREGRTPRLASSWWRYELMANGGRLGGGAPQLWHAIRRAAQSERQ